MRRLIFVGSLTRAAYRQKYRFESEFDSNGWSIRTIYPLTMSHLLSSLDYSVDCILLDVDLINQYQLMSVRDLVYPIQLNGYGLTMAMVQDDHSKVSKSSTLMVDRVLTWPLTCDDARELSQCCYDRVISLIL